MRRHDLLTLKQDAVVQSVACWTSDRAEHYVKLWIAEGWPFVCPRQHPQSKTVQLGLAFVDKGIKHRAFLQARHQDLFKRDSSHELINCLNLFSEKESGVLRHLTNTLNSAGYSVYVFGSVAWEMISGMPYRTEKSDLDLLCDVKTLQDVKYVSDVFAAAELELPFNIDGELRFPNDECVNWREVVAALAHHDQLEVLIKGETGVRMGNLDSLLELSYG